MYTEISIWRFSHTIMSTTMNIHTHNLFVTRMLGIHRDYTIVEIYAKSKYMVKSYTCIIFFRYSALTVIFRNDLSTKNVSIQQAPCSYLFVITRLLCIVVSWLFARLSNSRIGLWIAVERLERVDDPTRNLKLSLYKLVWVKLLILPWHSTKYRSQLNIKFCGMPKLYFYYTYASEAK